MNRLQSAAVTIVAGAALVSAGEVRTAVLLELFTSEGCSSCPAADRLLETLDRTQPFPGVNLIVLSEHVDYWDQQGWKDPFSSMEFTQRQQQYSNVFHIDSIFTPQLVIDGKRQVVGNDAAAARAAINDVVKLPKAQLTLEPPVKDGDHLKVKVSLTSSPGHAIVYIALADSRVQSQVLRGENTGRSLVHVGVLRKFVKVGTVKKDDSFSKDVQMRVEHGTGEQGLRLVAILQDVRSAKVLAVAQQKL